MNGHCQESREPGRPIPEERKQHIMVLLTRMVHQRLTANRSGRTEGAARKEREHQGKKQTPLRC
jgi:hypothetical protein